MARLATQADIDRAAKRKSRKSLHIGASRIRIFIEQLPRDEAVSLIKTLWPEVQTKTAHLMVDFPEETRVNGSHLLIPSSWGNL